MKLEAKDDFAQHNVLFELENCSVRLKNVLTVSPDVLADLQCSTVPPKCPKCAMQSPVPSQAANFAANPRAHHPKTPKTSLHQNRQCRCSFILVGEGLESEKSAPCTVPVYMYSDYQNIGSLPLQEKTSRLPHPQIPRQPRYPRPEDQTEEKASWEAQGLSK